jgi:hypothetical protein
MLSLVKPSILSLSSSESFTMFQAHFLATALPTPAALVVATTISSSLETRCIDIMVVIVDLALCNKVLVVGLGSIEFVDLDPSVEVVNLICLIGTIISIAAFESIQDLKLFT